jgi:predicted  nucleic acid-binding Zn-ribbon protein
MKAGLTTSNFRGAGQVGVAENLIESDSQKTLGILALSATSRARFHKRLSFTFSPQLRGNIMDSSMLILIGVLLVAIGIAVFLFLRMRKAKTERNAISQEHSNLERRVQGIVDVDAEKQRVLAELELERMRLQANISKLQASQRQLQQDFETQKSQGEFEVEKIRSAIARTHTDLQALEEVAELQSFGFYKPRYSFESSALYQGRLEKIRDQQKRMIKDKTAAVGMIEWAVNGSKAEGRKQINQTLKLILRAFNGESDAAIAKVKYNNVTVMETRIRKAWEAMSSLAAVQQCYVTPEYLDLKLQELYLVHEYQEKVQEEKEEQRRIREQMREEEIAQRELEKAKQDAEREEKRYEESLRKAREEIAVAVGAKQQKLLGQIETLQRMLEEAHANKERAIARAQMTRSGHVYIISNIGSFGDQVFKIGMTRRLDPMDRVRELGDASVPFQFDVHAVIYCDDAPSLENMLHRAFHHKRINRVNARKEFFRVSIEEITEAVRKHHGEIEMILMPEAVEYRKTLALLQENPSTSMPELLSQPDGNGIQASAILDI